MPCRRISTFLLFGMGLCWEYVFSCVYVCVNACVYFLHTLNHGYDGLIISVLLEAIHSYLSTAYISIFTFSSFFRSLIHFASVM